MASFMIRPNLVAPPTPTLHFLVYAWVPSKLGPAPFFVLQPGSWEQMTGLFGGGTEALCQFMWGAASARVYRVFWSLGPGMPLTMMPGGDRPGWQWFKDLGCYGLGWWKSIDWNALAKGPN